MYYIAFVVLLFFAIVEIITNKKEKQIFDVLFVGLTIMLCLRYGQGQDYFSYMYTYYNEPFYNYKEVLSSNDIGFYSLSYLCKNVMLLNFEWFAAIVGIISMLMFYKFFQRDCNYSILSLFAFYCFVFFIYLTSAIRQGLAMGIYVAFALPYAYDKKWVKYMLVVLISTSFHSSCLILLAVPLFYTLNNRLVKIGIILVSFAIMLFGTNLINLSSINYFLQNTLNHTGISEGDYLEGKIMRIVYTLPILLFLYKFDNEKMQRLFNLYICGLFIYSIFSFIQEIATRLWGYATPFLLAIIFSFRKDVIKFRRNVLLTWYMILAIVVFFNNISHFIEYSYNKQHVTVFTYPYFTVFDKQEAHHHIQYYNYINY